MSTFDSLDKNMPILVIDDAATMRKVIRNCLRQLGFNNVAEAENGASAVETLRSAPYKFVISNWTLQDLSGPDLLKLLRSQGNLQKVPFLMVTPSAPRVALPEPEKVGAANYIAKPFTATVLKAKMEAIFATA